MKNDVSWDFLGNSSCSCLCPAEDNRERGSGHGQRDCRCKDEINRKCVYRLVEFGASYHAGNHTDKYTDNPDVSISFYRQKVIGFEKSRLDWEHRVRELWLFSNNKKIVKIFSSGSLPSNGAGSMSKKKSTWLKRVKNPFRSKESRSEHDWFSFLHSLH